MNFSRSRRNFCNHWRGIPHTLKKTSRSLWTIPKEISFRLKTCVDNNLAHSFLKWRFYFDDISFSNISLISGKKVSTAVYQTRKFYFLNSHQKVWLFTGKHKIMSKVTKQIFYLIISLFTHFRHKKTKVSIFHKIFIFARAILYAYLSCSAEKFFYRMNVKYSSFVWIFLYFPFSKLKKRKR